MIVYLARDILSFVMYCVYGESRLSLLIESTDSMILFYYFNFIFFNFQMEEKIANNANDIRVMRFRKFKL